jgi:hypothetical protein
MARFSTTAIWNCRGSRSEAQAASRIRVRKLPGPEVREMKSVSRPRATSLSTMPSKPPNIQKVT